jgi:microcystin-dependent protein
MAQPYVGEIRMFGGNFAPAGWMFCEGQQLPISEYETLFQLIGTTYGGDGQTDFKLPDLRGRLPIHQGSGFVLAEIGGTETITLTVPQTPAHSHPLLAQEKPGKFSSPAAMLPAPSALRQFASSSATASMAATAISITGGSQPHDNFMPYLCVNFIISLYGLFPSPT